MYVTSYLYNIEQNVSPDTLTNDIFDDLIFRSIHSYYKGEYRCKVKINIA